MPDRIKVAQDRLDEIHDQLGDAHLIVDPVRQRREVQQVVIDLRKLADYLDPDSPK